MGTTLTGTTPQDTYDSLIKVTDNGPIGTSLKTLTDGLGNDSALALSSRGLKVNQSATLITDTASLCHFSNNYLYLRGGSAGLSIGDDAFSNSITLVDAGSIVFEAGSAERMRITSAGNVGIGTSAPTRLLTVSSGSDTYAEIKTTFADGDALLGFSNTADANSAWGVGRRYTGEFWIANYTGDFLSGTRTTPFQIASTGVIEISSGIKFPATQVASADANTLDDYEEGTWTPSFVMGTSGTITMDAVVGRYTKIGNLITCTGYANIASVSSPVGELRIGGLPFVTGTAGDSASSIYVYSFGNTTPVTAYQAFTIPTLSFAPIRGYYNGAQVTDIGANVVNGAGVIFTITYRV